MTTVQPTGPDRLTLPHILLEFNDGSSQHAVIELSMNEGINISTHELNPSTNEQSPREERAPPQQSNPSHHPESSNIATQSPAQETETQPGIPGLDRPAFDTSATGSSEQVDPVQGRILDDILGQSLRTSEEDDTESRQRPRDQKNIMITVNYLYADDTNSRSANTNNQTPNNTSRTSDSERVGSLSLHVPDLPDNADDYYIDVLIKLTTSIALSVITSMIKKRLGLSREKFDELETPSLDTVHDITCPICYDEFVAAPTKPQPTDTNQRKRKREDDDHDDTDSNKLRKNSETKKTNLSTKVPPRKEYTHCPVKVPCGHIFGQTCLYEWLKENNTCPLCRTKASNVGHGSVMQDITLRLPNLASIVYENSDFIRSMRNSGLAFTPVDYGSPRATTATAAVAAAATTGATNSTPSTSAQNRPLRMIPLFPGRPDLGLARGVTVPDVIRRIIDSLTDRIPRRNMRPTPAAPTATSSPVTGSNTSGSQHQRSFSAVRAPWNPVSAMMLNEVLQSRWDSGSPNSNLFPAGVASRRTRDGVVTEETIPQHAAGPVPESISQGETTTNHEQASSHSETPTHAQTQDQDTHNNEPEA
ncbi:hypothetical protein LJB42_003297 [Komagataella kurtzmanii]|nr:hypothetical protein LJB42_003297 [Komagataella kurtzmanii]